jgi:REP element-mobilizing transposase RayT
MQFQEAHHSFGASALHLQFTPKKRRKAFMHGFLQKACRPNFEDKARQLGVSLEACEFGPDHVHLFFTHWKNCSIPQLAQHFKGASARQILNDFGDFLAHYKMGNSLWTDGYFYETCGNVSAEYRRFYIERMILLMDHIFIQLFIQGFLISKNGN